MWAPVDADRRGLEARQPEALGPQSGQELQGQRDRTKATDNHHHLRREAEYDGPLLTENLLELGHTKKGSGPANWWALPRPFIFQSTHKGGFTDIPTRDFQGLRGRGVQANTADILYYYSFQPNSNTRCSIRAVPLVCWSECARLCWGNN